MQESKKPMLLISPADLVRELNLESENYFKRMGVVVVIAHRQPSTGKVLVYLERNKPQKDKGIDMNQWGYPSETFPEYRTESIKETIVRCFKEELGFKLEDMPLKTKKDFSPRFFYFNDGGVGSTNTKSVGIVYVFWTDKPTLLPIKISSKEVNRAGWFTPEAIIRAKPGRLRLAPNTRQLTQELLKSHSFLAGELVDVLDLNKIKTT